MTSSALKSAPLTQEEVVDISRDLTMLLFRNQHDSFMQIWNRLSEGGKTQVANYVEPSENTTLLSYVTYALPHYFNNDPRQVSGDPTRVLCEYAPEKKNDIFFDINTNIYETALTKALGRGMSNVALALLDCGADPDATPVLDLGDQGHMFVQPIMHAANNGNYEVYKKIAHRIELSNQYVDWKQRTPLRWAKQGQFLQVNHANIYPELDDEHEKIIEDLRRQGVNQLTGFGCEIFNYEDVVEGLYSNNNLVSDSRESLDFKSFTSEFNQDQPQILRDTVTHGLKKCQQVGYTQCEVVDEKLLSNKLPHISSNPRFEMENIVRSVNFGSKQAPHVLYMGIQRQKASIFIYGLDEGIQPEDCRWLK